VIIFINDHDFGDKKMLTLFTKGSEVVWPIRRKINSNKKDI